MTLRNGYHVIGDDQDSGEWTAECTGCEMLVGEV